MFILYVYVPALAVAEIRAMFQSLADTGHAVTHLGKNDPPKKWSGSREEATAMILAGTDLTLSTFVRDAKHRLDMTVEIHRDPRWQSSTISASMPEEVSLRILGEHLTAHIRSFAAILGRSGAGKDQRWQILHLADDCPSDLKAKIG